MAGAIHGHTKSHCMQLMSSKSLLNLIIITGICFLTLIGFSFLRPLQGSDSGSCRGVYMSPAYARVYGFDETHTPYASKYSLYLYREQNKDPMPAENDESDLGGSISASSHHDYHPGSAHAPHSSHFHLTGTPVLFIPGNAGSFRQVRSIAAEAATQFYDHHKDIIKKNSNATALDFFAADFNGDFTAFHGRTMLDQAEYLNDAVKFILSLYSTNKKPAHSVILLGHSMGGVVARVMLTLPNYIDGSVQTILTLAAPHAAAPATFDGELLNLMRVTDDFWRSGYTTIAGSRRGLLRLRDRKYPSAHQRLSNLTIVSITGGIKDTTLPADYTVLTGLVPLRNGLTVTTSGIPGVWMPMDHLAIVWCDQLRHIVAQTLLEITDSSMEVRNKEQRMEIFRRNFVGDDIPDGAELKTFSALGLKLDINQLKDDARERSFALPEIGHSKNSERRSIKSVSSDSIPSIHMFHVPEGGKKYKFNLISSLKPTPMNAISNGDAPAVLICRPAVSKESGNDSDRRVYVNGESFSLDSEMDYTTDSTTQFVELECLDVHSAVKEAPRSYPETKSVGSSSFGGNKKPFYTLELPHEILKGFNTVVIVESANGIGSNNFFLADLVPEESCQVTLGDKSLWGLLTKGYDITLPSHRPLIVGLDVPSARSSLLTYSFDFRFQSSHLERFSPFLSQSIADETKWHINLGGSNVKGQNINGRAKVDSRIMGVSPFCPYNTSDSSLHLKLYADSFLLDEVVDIYMSVDWFKSLRNLVLRYRLSVVGLPVFVTCLILFMQLKRYASSGVFVSFYRSFTNLCSPQILIPILLGSSLLSVLCTNPYLGWLLRLFDPIHSPDSNLMAAIGGSDVKLNDIFLGIGEPALWFYGPIAIIMAIALVGTLYGILITLLKLAGELACLLSSVFPSINSIRVTTGSWLGNRRRTFSVIILTALVLFYFPYQFAFVTCFFTQVFVVIKTKIHQVFIRKRLNSGKYSMLKLPEDCASASSSSTSLASSVASSAGSTPPSSPASGFGTSEYFKGDNTSIQFTKRSFTNYEEFNISLLLLMAWILPINIPVLIVWVHNFSLKWATPFSSHHNLLAVLPTVILIQMNNAGCIFSRHSLRSLWAATDILILYMAYYAALFGTRHLFCLHHLFNILCGWFLVLIFWDYMLGRSCHYIFPNRAVLQEKLH